MSDFWFDAKTQSTKKKIIDANSVASQNMAEPLYVR